MKIALDPTPFHHDYELLDFPRVVAELGFEYMQLTPHRDFIPFSRSATATSTGTNSFPASPISASTTAPTPSWCPQSSPKTRTPTTSRATNSKP
jgi:hypothetical protein